MVHGKLCSEPDRAGRPDGQEAESGRVIESRLLFGEERTVAIRHGAELYTLRITRADKLILTK